MKRAYKSRSKKSAAPVVAPAHHIHRAYHYMHPGLTLGTLILIFAAVGAAGAAYTGYQRFTAATRAASEARQAKTAAERRAAEFEARVRVLEAEKVSAVARVRSFDPRTARVGDVFAGLTVISADGGIRFGGQVTLYGEYRYAASPLEPQLMEVTFTPDPSESAKLPAQAIFLLDPSAKAAFGITGRRAFVDRAVVVLDGLTYSSGDSDVGARATLVEVLVK